MMHKNARKKLMGKVAVESPLVNSLFTCPLCHGLIRSPMVINECLHRFCKLCITNFFEKTPANNKCPTCQVMLVNPMDTLKADLTFQRLLYKIFPTIYQHEIACRPSLLSPAISNESTRIYIDSTIDVYLEYWDISLDLFPNSTKSSITLPSCYLECKASTPLSLLEKFIRNKHLLSADLQIDLFYKTFLLNSNTERLIDICFCFDRMNRNQTLDIRFLISPHGYKAILNRIRELKHPIPPSIEISEQIKNPTEKETSIISPASSSSSASSSIDPKLKVKIRRSQTSVNDWYISHSKQPPPSEPVELPDLVNSCETTKKITKRKQPTASPSEPTMKKKPCTTSTFFSPGHVSQPNRTSITKPQTKPRRRTRFIPTMVKAPPSILDRFDDSDPDHDHCRIYSTNDFSDASATIFRPSEIVIASVEENVTETMDTKGTKKTICKVPPYIPEISTMSNSPPEKSLSIVKPTPLHPTLTPMRRTLLPKKIPTIIPFATNRIPSPDSTTNAAPLDLSLK